MKFFLLGLCAIAGCSSNNNSLEYALDRVIAFEAKPERIRQVFSNFPEKSQEQGMLDVYTTLGTNNLSSFLLACPLDELNGYSIKFSPDPMVISRKCAYKGESLVDSNAITNLVTLFSSASGDIAGRFDIKANDIGLLAVCEFQAHVNDGEITIVRLVIPSKKGNKKKPLVVFDRSNNAGDVEEAWMSSPFFEEIPVNEL